MRATCWLCFHSECASAVADTATGLLEILGAIGLLVPFTARAASVCLVLLLITMFPANVRAARQNLTTGGSAATENALAVCLYRCSWHGEFWRIVTTPPNRTQSESLRYARFKLAHTSWCRRPLRPSCRCCNRWPSSGLARRDRARTNMRAVAALKNEVSQR
jgi:hypothetical protein